MDLPLQIDLVGTKAHHRLDYLEWSSNRPEPQAPPLQKPFVP